MERGGGHKAGNQSLGSRNLFPKLAPMGRSFVRRDLVRTGSIE